MSVIAVPSQPGGWKSFPAGLRGSCPGNGEDRLRHTGDSLQAGISGLGYTAQEIVAMIQAGTAATLPLAVVNNPGTIFTQLPDGTIQVYSQPTGSTANLPGVYGSALLQGGASIQPGQSNVNANLGPAAFSAQFDMDKWMPYLLIGGGIFAVVMLAGKK